MNRTTFCAALLGGALMAGCAPYGWIPSAEPFPESSLRTAMSAQHWDVIANDAVAQTTTLRDRAALAGRALYVVPSTDGSAFSRAFHAMLVTRLVNSGLTVATRPEGAVEVRYEAQVVRHVDDYAGVPPYGAVTVLGDGVWVARRAWVDGRLVWADNGTVETFGRHPDYWGGATRTEVVITTSLIDDGRYAGRKTDVYYVQNLESLLFEPAYRGQTKTLGVTGQ